MGRDLEVRVDHERIHEVILRAQQQLSCPVCDRDYDLSDLRIKGHVANQYLVQAGCNKDHNPTLTLYVVVLQPQTQTTAAPLVTTDHVLDIHQQLKSFDGDFRTLFQKLEHKG